MVETYLQIYFKFKSLNSEEIMQRNIRYIANPAQVPFLDLLWGNQELY